MAGTLHLASGHLTTTVERSHEKLRLHLRDNAKCDSAIVDLSVADARAIVDALSAYLPERAV